MVNVRHMIPGNTSEVYENTSILRMEADHIARLQRQEFRNGFTYYYQIVICLNPGDVLYEFEKVD